jgi:acyl transferase domain-containing protein/pimeloyl-ACP methyl ester carboxylesterase/acyl carrier protein
VQLQQQVQNLLECIDREGYGDAQLASIAFTLQTGREAMEWRLGAVVQDMQALKTLLRAAVVGEQSDQIMRGQVRKHVADGFRHEDQELDMLTTAWLAQGRLQRLLQAWMGGQAVNWLRLYEGARLPRRISLPTYPFLRTLYRVGYRLPSVAPTAEQAPVLALVPRWQPAASGAAALSRSELRLVTIGVSALQRAQLAALHPVLELAAVGESFALLTTQLLHYLQDTGNPEQPALLQVVLGSECSTACAEGLWSMLKTLMLEFDRLGAQLIQLGRDMHGDAADFVVHCRDAGSGYLRSGREGQLQQQVWEETELAPASATPWREGGVYLITGGLGGLGQLLLNDIGQALGQAVVILTGRSSQAVATQRTPLPQAAGIRVEYLSLDVADAAAVQTAISDILARHGELSGVLHLAGVTHDSYLLDKTDEQVHAVLAPKVLGVQHLDAATAHLPLELFVGFSSISSVSGNPGQLDYAAANGFLDGFIADRQLLVAQGLRRGRSLSINWPLWASGGMQLDAELVADMSRRFGSVALPAASGLACFHRACGTTVARVAFVAGDTEVLRRNLLPLINRQAPTRAATAPQPAELQQPQGAREWLLQRMARLLKMDVADLDVEVELADYGFDSVLFSAFVSEINQAYGLDLSPATLLGYTTLARLEAFLMQRMVPLPVTPASAANAPLPLSLPRQPDTAPAVPVSLPGATEVADTDIAIIGMNVRLPGVADDEAFWALLCREGSTLGSDQAELWASRGASLDAQAYPWGSLFADVGQFAPALFGISEEEAVLIDPQERHALMACWQAMLNAGYNREQLATAEGDRSVGVYIGVTRPSYNLIGMERRLQGQQAFTGVSFASIANRISHVLNLTGPSMPVDTMCASSHLALSLACDSLISGETHMAFAGGVNIYSHPSVLADADRLKLLSTRSQHESFGSDGSGFVPAEAAGVVLLKPLRRALADGDQVYAVIKGTAQRHSGRSLGYFAANPRGQAQVMQAALDRAGMTAADIDYLEAQGTGSQVADAVEAAAIDQVYASEHRSRALRVGCVKPNVGHAESASGMTQLLKVILQLRQAWLLPTRLPHMLNPGIPWRAGQVVLQAVGEAWNTPVRRAAINGFGAGGVCVHLVLEQAPEVGVTPRARRSQPTLVPISAHSESALRDYAQRLGDSVASGVGQAQARLRDIAFTLAQGREPYACRAVLVADDLDDLQRQLAELAAGRAPQTVLHTAAQALIEHWLMGREVAWLRDGWIESGQRLLLPVPRLELLDCWPVRPTDLGASAPAVSVASPALPGAAAPVPTLEPLPGVGLQQQMIAMSSLLLLRFCQGHQVFVSRDAWLTPALQTALGWSQRPRLLGFTTAMMQASGLLEPVPGGWRATRAALNTETQRSIEYFGERVQMLGRAMPALHASIQLLDSLWQSQSLGPSLSAQTVEDGRRAVLAGCSRLAQGADLLVEQALATHLAEWPTQLRVLELGNTSLGLLHLVHDAVCVAGTQLRVSHCASSDKLRALRQDVVAAQLPEVVYASSDWAWLDECLQESYDLLLVSPACLAEHPELSAQLAARRELLLVHDAFDQQLVSMVFGLADEQAVDPVGGGIVASLVATLEQHDLELCTEFLPALLLARGTAPAEDPTVASAQPVVLEHVLRVFNDTLASDREVLAHTDLRDLAPTSLEVAMVFAELAREYADAIGHQDLFSCFTPGELAARVAARLPGTSARGFAQAVCEAYRQASDFPLASPLHGDELLSARLFTSRQGLELEYFSGGEGEPLLFLTALAFTKTIWEEQIKALYPQHLLIFPHLPGHGGSRFSGQRFSFQDLADALIELLDHLGVVKVHLVGWCMAGNIAQLMALEHAHRLKSLALVCTTPTDVRARGLSAVDLYAYSADPLQTYDLEFANLYPARAEREQVGRYMGLIRRAHSAVEPGAMMYLFAGLTGFDTQRRLHQIQVPTLIFAGARDIAFPIEQVALLERIPNSQLVRMQGSGHMPFLNQAELFNRTLLAFIERHCDPHLKHAVVLQDEQ